VCFILFAVGRIDSDDFIIDPDSDEEDEAVGVVPSDAESGDDARSSNSEFHTPEAVSPAEKLAGVDLPGARIYHRNIRKCFNFLGPL
jgi:hypothetical protein